MARRTALIVVLACVAAVTSAAASPRPPQPSTYLALGDSVAAGVGADHPGTTGYVARLHEALADARRCGRGQALGCRLALQNLALPGATTTTLISGQLPQALGLLEQRNADPTPVNDVRLITLDIGGNDLFGPVTRDCSTAVTPTCLATVDEQLLEVARNYSYILSALRTAAGPTTTIAVMTYYNPLPACHLDGLTRLAELVLEGGGAIATGLNDIIRDAAARSDAVVVDSADVVGANDLVGGSDCLHPDDSGHADIAAAFAASVGDRSGRPGAVRD